MSWIANKPNIFELADELDYLGKTESNRRRERLSSIKITARNSGSFDDDDISVFPRNLLLVLRSQDGNLSCVDCNRRVPLDWANVSYGTLLCADCAYSHIATGVSERDGRLIRSLSQHNWMLSDVIALLEGGNKRYAKFVGLSNETDSQRRFTMPSNTKQQPHDPQRRFSSHSCHANDSSTPLRRGSFLDTFMNVVTKAGSVVEDHRTHHNVKEKLSKEYEMRLKERVGKVVAYYTKRAKENDLHVKRSSITSSNNTLQWYDSRGFDDVSILSMSSCCDAEDLHKENASRTIRSQHNARAS